MPFKKILLGAVAACALSTAAQASVTVYVWTGLPDGGAPSNATLAQSGFPGAIGSGPLGAPNGTTTVNGINFSTNNSAGTTIATWLGVGGLPAAVANAVVNDSYMLFTGDIFLNAGLNTFNITHDDGVALSVDGGATVSALSAGPTSPTTTPFTITTPGAGNYHFALSYGECCSGPAVLNWSYLTGQPVGSVPEASTWAMMLLGFAGIGMAVRRSRKPAMKQLA
jgi:hypothetical protein